MKKWYENGQLKEERTYKDGEEIISINSIVGYDWCTPNCSDPTSSFKFSSDGSFNFSTIMFGGMSRWGTWKDFGSNTIQTKDNTVGIQIIQLISDDKIKVGRTTYVRGN